jgi:tRNA1Val (adenine37-N6)-methyltransferase
VSNSFFSFKQFTIHQDACAMKVCTDSCLFGAMLSTINYNAANALDIGSGTGLLSLMYAQKNSNCKIDAIEIDEAAYTQSLQNISQSTFSTYINTLNKSILDFDAIEKYNFIFSNPPFFKASLKSPNKLRNLAMHNDVLSYELLIKKTTTLLAQNGLFAVLLPFTAQKEFIEIALQQKLFITTIINIQQTFSHSFFRTILVFSFQNSKASEQTISIKNNENQHTEQFVDLLKDYYLNL